MTRVLTGHDGSVASGLVHSGALTVLVVPSPRSE
jgi:hypothetical protein